MGIIKDIYDIGKDLYSVVNTVNKESNTKLILEKESLSHLLYDIGVLLNETYLQIKQHEYPADKCKELEVLAYYLKDLLKNFVDKDRAIAISEQLLMAHRVEKLFQQVQTGEVSKLELEQLNEAAGFFKANSKLIKFL